MTRACVPGTTSLPVRVHSCNISPLPRFTEDAEGLLTLLIRKLPCLLREEKIELAVTPSSCVVSLLGAVLSTPGALQPTTHVDLPSCPLISSHMEAESIINRAMGKGSIMDADNSCPGKTRPSGEGVAHSEGEEAATSRVMVPFSAGRAMVRMIGRQTRGTSWWRPTVTQEG